MRKYLLLVVLALCIVATVEGVSNKGKFASNDLLKKKGPKISTKVFFDVSIDGEPAGRIGKHRIHLII
jgi:hypothetical protein